MAEMRNSGLFKISNVTCRKTEQQVSSNFMPNFLKSIFFGIISSTVVSTSSYALVQCPMGMPFPAGPTCCAIGNQKPLCEPGYHSLAAVSGGAISSCDIQGRPGAVAQCVADAPAAGGNSIGNASASNPMLPPGAGGLLNSPNQANPIPGASILPDVPSKPVKEGKTGTEFNPRTVSSGDRCNHSAKIDSKFGCDTTYNTVQMASLSNIMTQTVGSMATQMMGQQGQMNAMQAGTQSAALQAAATTQKQTATTQMGLGGVNAALGIYQIAKAVQHSRMGDRITREGNATDSLNPVKYDAATNNADTETIEAGKAGWVDSTAAAGGVQSNILKNYKLNENSGVAFQVIEKEPLPTDPQYTQKKKLYDEQVKAREKDSTTHKNRIIANVGEITRDANSEQKSMSSAAMAGGMFSFMTGTQQLMSGGMGLAAAQQLQNAANALNKGNGTPIISTVTPPTNKDFTSGGAQGPLQANTISGNGANPNGTSTDTTTGSTDPLPNLGPGFNPLPMNSGVPGGPPAGKFVSGNGQSGPPGGGGAVADGGGTQAAGPTPEDPQAKLAANSGGSGYSSSGSYSSAGGGKGPGGEGGGDLSGLLSKFLPHKEDTPQNGILQFGNQGAGADQPMSLLGKDANIFERVHDTYQDKSRQGHI